MLSTCADLGRFYYLIIYNSKSLLHNDLQRQNSNFTNNISLLFYYFNLLIFKVLKPLEKEALKWAISLDKIIYQYLTTPVRKRCYTIDINKADRLRRSERMKNWPWFEITVSIPVIGFAIYTFIDLWWM